MKITQLDIEGFRSLKKVSWKPGNLNVIIGPNGSGKSNILRILEMITAAAQGQLGSFVQREGGFGTILWDGQSISVQFQIEVEFPGNQLIVEPLNYHVSLGRFNNYDYRVKNETLLGAKTNFPHFIRDLLKTNVSYKNDYGQIMTRTFKEEQVQNEEPILASVAGPWSEDYATVLFQEQFVSWSIYQDIRVDRNALIRQPVVSKVEYHVESHSQNLISVLHTLYTTDREFKQLVNTAMRAAFGSDFDELIFPPASDQRIQLRVRWKTLKREQSAADLSDGTLRFLFLLAVLANPNPSSLIAIDEPETGLHPSMLPIIAELAVDAAERTQIIFTTHSDQFLDAFTETKPTTTVARWENGETTLTTLSDEDLAYWLKDYSLGKMFRSGELEALA